MCRFPKTPLVATAFVLLAACPPQPPAPYRIVHYGEISVGDVSQWEISSAALPGQTAEELCGAFQRNSGDPQIFVSWNAEPFPRAPLSHQWTLSCAVSQLGQLPRGCDSDDARTILPLLDVCPTLVAGSNDNISMRLRDDRIVTVFQTLERYCPQGGEVDPLMPLAEAMGDGDGDEDGRCEQSLPVGDLCQAGMPCAEPCAELAAFNGGNPSVACDPEQADLAHPCAPYWKQALYYTRLSNDCGTSWHASRLRATAARYTNGAPFETVGNDLQEGPVFTLDRVEGYADPFSDNLYLTASAGQWGDHYTSLFFHAAVPPGENYVDWRVLFQHDATAPTVMTSVEHAGGVSRVYWFNCLRGRPMLYFADDPWARATDISAGGQGALPEIHDLGAALATAEGQSEYACEYKATKKGTFPVRNSINVSIARVATDGVNDVIRVVYPQLFKDEGGEYQSARIVDVRVNKSGELIAVLPATNRVLLGTRVVGAGPLRRASVLWPEIIQTDEPTTQDPAAATQILRWTEVDPGGDNLERFASWDPTKPWVGSSECPGWDDCTLSELWSPNHTLDRWTCVGDCATGDYQYGAFVQVVDECTHDFFVPWGRREDLHGDSFPESTRTHAAMVTTTPQGCGDRISRDSR